MTGVSLILAALCWAYATDRVMPEGDLPCTGLMSGPVELALARGETEALQIVVTADGPLAGVRATVEGLPLDAVCETVGYVRTTNQVFYTASSVGRPAWYPDVLLPTPTEGVAVPAGRRQSFWLRVHAPVAASPGVFEGRVRVVSDAGPLGIVPLRVRVWDFALPSAPALPLAITFDPCTSLPADSAARAACAAAPAAPLALWRRQEDEWYRFLADYGLTPDNLYWNHAAGPLADAAARWRALARLKAEGRLGRFNLGYFAPLAEGTDAAAKWRAQYLVPIQRAYARARAAGLLAHAYIYGCDETPSAQALDVGRAIAAVKAACPGVPVMVTAKDDRGDGTRAFGCGTPLAAADIIVPLTDKYVPEQAARARAEGRQVWWYVCCWPHGTAANLFLESRPIEARLLTGVLSVASRVDGFLYYQISIWNAPAPVGSAPYTDWTAQSWEHYNGDGSLTRVAADGAPRATIRLENVRDGLEDYAYARLYMQRFGCWPAIPAAVAVDSAHYAPTGAALYAWRARLGAALESGIVAPEKRP